MSEIDRNRVCRRRIPIEETLLNRGTIRVSMSDESDPQSGEDWIFSAIRISQGFESGKEEGKEQNFDRELAEFARRSDLSESLL